MPTLTTDLDTAAYARIADRANKQGRTVEQQAAVELSAEPAHVFRVLPPLPTAKSVEESAAAMKRLRDRQAASGRMCETVVADLREDRDR